MGTDWTVKDRRQEVLTPRRQISAFILQKLKKGTPESYLGEDDQRRGDHGSRRTFSDAPAAGHQGGRPESRA